MKDEMLKDNMELSFANKQILKIIKDADVQGAIKEEDESKAADGMKTLLTEEMLSNPDGAHVQRVNSTVLSKKEVFNYNELAKEAYGEDELPAI